MIRNPFLDEAATPAAANPFLDTTPPPRNYAWSEVPGAAVGNFIPNAVNLASNIKDAVLDPVNTAKTMGKLGVGMVQEFIPGQQQYETQYADPFYEHIFGDVGVKKAEGGGLTFDQEQLKRNLAERPVDLMLDASIAARGVGGALGKAPGAVGTVGRGVATVGRAIDPVTIVPKTVAKTAAITAGLTTGVGGKALKTAVQAGYEGGEAGKAFRDSMRGNVPLEDVLIDAKRGLDAIKQERQTAYKSGMADLSKDQTVLDFGKIDATLAGTKPVAEFKGISLNPSAEATVTELAQVLEQWRKLDPKEFHTAEGFDALKQRIGDIVANTERGSPAQKVATQVYNVVKDQITAQAPEYAKTMRGYSEASDLIRQMEKTLSLNPKASVDTQLRKLQSIMRNNVNTSYGHRADLVKLLEEKGAKNITAKLAGQALNSYEPRGLSRAVAALGPIASAGLGVMTMNPLALGAIGGQLAASSPRIMGEVAHGAGRVANVLSGKPIRNALMRSN
jgi:hypothetical protein